MKRKHISVPSWGPQPVCHRNCTKKSKDTTAIYMKRTQEPGTGWNRGEPRKPPAVWAPPPGNARPEGRRETREKTRRGAGEARTEGSVRLGSLTLQRNSCSEDGVGNAGLRAGAFDNRTGILAAENDAQVAVCLP